MLPARLQENTSSVHGQYQKHVPAVKKEVFRYKHIFAFDWFHKDLRICCSHSYARSWILSSVLQDTSVISAVTRPFHPQNQTRKRRAHLNIALLISYAAAWTPILQWCCAGSCSVQWGAQAGPGAAESTVLPLPFPLKNDVALWHSPQALSLGIPLMPLTCHSPACGHSLHVQDTLFVSPRDKNLFPILQLSPWITAKMHRASNGTSHTPSCST